MNKKEFSKEIEKAILKYYRKALSENAKRGWVLRKQRQNANQ